MSTATRATVSFVGACLPIVLVSLVFFHTFSQVGEAAASRKRTHEVLDAAGNLLLDLKDTEINQRDYLLTGDGAVLAAYEASRNDAHEHLAEMRRLTADRPDQQHRLDVIASLLAGRLDLLKQTVELRHEQNHTAALALAQGGRSLELTSKLSVELTDFIKTEHGLREQHNAEFELTRHRMLRIIAVGSLTAVLLALLATHLISLETRRRIEVQAEMNRELEEQVTERTQALSEAMQSRNSSNSQLETILANITEGVAVSGLDGQLLFFNRAALNLHGFATLDECRLHLSRFPDIFELSTLDGMVLPVEQWPLSRILRGETLRNLEIRLRHRRANWQRDVNYGGTIVRDVDDQPLMAIVTIGDITERKQAELEIRKLNTGLEQRVTDRTEELERANTEMMRANRTKDSFLAAMSHEIRTPLGGMLGMLELLSLSPLEKEQKKTLQAARESGASLLRILSDILDWSKIEAGKLGLSLQATSLRLLLQEVVTTYSHVASAKGLALWQHVDVRLGPAHIVDPLRLSQILNNLVSNAIKFTKNGEIEVRADLLERSDGGEQVRFSVRDTGIGIEPEQQVSLFKDYTQATANTARMYGGTGLGLAISSRLLALMQGRIELASAPGQGSTFSITLNLPVTEPELAEGAVVGDVPVQPLMLDRSAAPTVLLVDDHPINLALLAQQVELLGLRSKRAEDGEAALALWRGGGIALILTDVHMPKLDGYGLTAAIRRIELEEARPHMPIIANTANALQEEKEQCRAAGIDEVLVKPATLAKLRATLLHWLPELGDFETTAAAHEAVFDGASSPIDYTELRNIIPDRAGQMALLRTFKLHQNADLQHLMAEFNRGDLAGTALTAHRIKGASRMAGAKELATSYAALEQAAKQNDSDAARQAIITLNAAVSRFETHLAGLTDTKEQDREGK